MKVHYTRPAAAEIVAILDHVAARSPQDATRVRDRLRAVERLLAQFPNAGQPTRLPWLRRIAVRRTPYLVFYEVAVKEIVIHSIWHVARNPSDRPA